MVDLENFAPMVDMEIDPGIRRAVLILRSAGVDTFESCQGGEGHACPEPTVRFSGGDGAGFHALGVCLDWGLPVLELGRCWQMEGGVPAGPYWRLTFLPSAALAQSVERPICNGEDAGSTPARSTLISDPHEIERRSSALHALLSSAESEKNTDGR